MSIGSITSTGKQNAAVAGGLKYKKIQKSNVSFCFLADDSVVDFASLVNFILRYGGAQITETDTEYHYNRRTAIMAGSGAVTATYLYTYTTLVVSQRKVHEYDEWPTPTVITAVGFRDSSSSPYLTMTIDSSWTVV